MLRTLALTLVLALALAAPAAAAEITSTNSKVTYEDKTGAVDQINIGITNPNWVFNKQQGAATTFAPVSPCFSNDNNQTVFCPANSATTIDVLLGGGNDNLIFNHGGSLNYLGNLYGGPGNDFIITGSTNVYMFGGDGNDVLGLQGFNPTEASDGGEGDDILTGARQAGTLGGGPGFDTATYQNTAAGSYLTISLDGVANDGIHNSPGANVKADVEKVVGSLGPDELLGNDQDNELLGSDGGDQIKGNGGADVLKGEGGSDTIDAQDGVKDTIDCGFDSDTAKVDPVDEVSNCETLQYADADNDGANAKFDCNESDPSVRPGANDTPGDGVDQDCSGGDAPLPAVDRDGDGATVPSDCDDDDPAIRPGAVDKPGNFVDEDCSGADQPFTRLTTPFGNKWSAGPKGTKVLRLVIDGAPAGSRVVLKCKGRGCPFKSRNVKAAKGRFVMTKLFRKQLRVGATLEVRLLHKDHIGKVVRYKIRRSALPAATALCMRPDVTKPSAC